MVSTRNHPSAFPPPELSPQKSSPTKSPRKSMAGSSITSSPSSSPAPTSTTTTKRQTSSFTASSSRNLWSHTPTNLTLIWLAVSLPLVIWDTGYVILRPHSMPGGKFHWPLWVPYELYGTIDYVYGWPALEKHNGFTAAQGTLNALETLMYGYYLYIAFTKGQSASAKGRGAPKPGAARWLGEARTVSGNPAARAVLIAFAASVMTLSKTVLYWLNEYFSEFENIGHNSVMNLVVLWIIPNGLWLVFPTYMTYVFGQEIIQGLETVSEATAKKTR